MRRAALPLSALMSGLLWASAAGAAGFDCAKAGTADEVAVCADERLSDLDSRLALAYAQAKKAATFDDVKQVAQDFLADRKACRSNAACIMASYVFVLGQLQMRGAHDGVPAEITAETIAGGRELPASGLPEAVGQCVATTIESVHPRVGDPDLPIKDEDYDAGTGVEFGNGGYQVSYDRETALIASKPGDPAVMCLVALPHRCPPGDDRGRVYTTTNQRTGATWTMADSQHMCGGA